MSLKPVTRTEHFMGRAAGNPGAEKLTPVTREEHFLEDIVRAIEAGGGGGGTVDQSYNALSTNAQSGTAVAEAILDRPTLTVRYSNNKQTAGLEANGKALVFQKPDDAEQIEIGMIRGGRAVANSYVVPTKKYVDDAIPNFHTLNSSASIEQTKNNTMHRLSVGLEDNTNKIDVHIWNGNSEKQWHAETEQSLRKDTLVGATPDLSIPNGATFVTTAEPDLLSLKYVVMDDNDNWTGVRVTDTSPFIFNRKGTSTEICRLTVTEGSPGEWEVSAYDDSIDPKTWNFFKENPVVPRVQSWLDLPVADYAMSDTSKNAVQNKVIKDYVDSKAGVNIAVGKETWYGTYTDENDVTYQVYTKTIHIPALPDTAGVTRYDHGVSNIKQILQVYGFTTDGFVLNAPRQSIEDNISIYQASKTASNQTVSIEVGKDRSSKAAYVTLVYVKNN